MTEATFQQSAPKPGGVDIATRLQLMIGVSQSGRLASLPSASVEDLLFAVLTNAIQLKGWLKDRPHAVPKNTDLADLLRQDIEARAELGKQVYGTRLQAGNGRYGLIDAYQELLDAAMYHCQYLEEKEETKSE